MFVVELRLFFFRGETRLHRDGDVGPLRLKLDLK